MKAVFNKVKAPFVKAYDKAEKFFHPINLKLSEFLNSKFFVHFKKYFFWGLALLFLILSVSLPFVTLNNGHKYTLFGLLSLVSNNSNGQLIYISVVNVACVVLPIVGIVFFLIEELTLKNKKHNYIISKILGILYLVLSYMLLATTLCYKKGFESAGLDSKFLMKQVGFAFYSLLFVVVMLSFMFFRRGRLAASYIVLFALCIVWLFPLLFIVFTSFRAERGFYTDSFIPNKWSFDAYIRLFTDTSIFQFGRWFRNTLLVAASTCVLSTCIIVSISFVLSRFNFKSKKMLISGFLIMGMFPGFMSMIAIYYIIKALGLNQSLFALILCYSGGSAAGYYIVKGFIDTIPKDIDEAAMIDGASKLQIFFRIILPLAKPILIYTVLTSFMSPWGDYIFASVIMGDNYNSYTVALGLYMMLQNSYINSWYTSFAAGAVLVAVPISVLFIALNRYYVEGLSGSVKG